MRSQALPAKPKAKPKAKAKAKAKPKAKAKDKLPVDPTWRKPTSPSRRKEPWVGVIVRAPVYAMLRELAEHYDIAIGEVVRRLVEPEFKKTLWRIQQEQLREQRGGGSVDKA